MATKGKRTRAIEQTVDKTKAYSVSKPSSS